MLKLFSIIISVILTASSSLGEFMPLPSGVFQMSGTDFNLPDNDLRPLDQTLLKDANVVSIGDVVPGSEGFYQVKARLIRYLIEKHGFRFFGMEENWVSSQGVET